MVFGASHLSSPSLIVVRSGVNCPCSQPADFNRRFILPTLPSLCGLLRWSLFAAGRGQDVNSFTACGNPTIRLAAPVKKGSGTLSAPPPRRVSPLRSLSSCSSTPAAFWLHSTRARRECMHSKFQFYHMERMRNFEILKSQNCGKVCLPIRISGSAWPA